MIFPEFEEFHFKFKSQIDFQQIFVTISCPSSRTRRVLVSNDGYIRYSNLGRIVDVKRIVCRVVKIYFLNIVRQ